jgi:hypothetical protein
MQNCERWDTIGITLAQKDITMVFTVGVSCEDKYYVPTGQWAATKFYNPSQNIKGPVGTMYL